MISVFKAKDSVSGIHVPCMGAAASPVHSRGSHAWFNPEALISPVVEDGDHFQHSDTVANGIGQRLVGGHRFSIQKASVPR